MKFSLKKSIIIGLSTWFYVILLFLLLEDKTIITKWGERWFNGQGDWWIFTKFFYGLTEVPIIIFPSIALVMGVIIGFYLVEKGGKEIFLSPLKPLFVSGIISIALVIIIAPELHLTFPEGIAFLIYLFLLIFLFFVFSFLFSILCYFEKENLFLGVTGLILGILIIGSIMGGKYLISQGVPLTRRGFENKLAILQKEAIETGNLNLCEGINEIIGKVSAFETKEELELGRDILKGTEPFKYYESCIEEVAVKTENVFLCKGLSGAYYQYRCITNIAKKQNNPTLCEEVESSYYGKCREEVMK